MGSAKVASQVIDWIRDKFEQAGLQTAVVGLSGGIDSAVVAALCKRALGEAVVGVLMSCHSNPQDRADALRVAEILAVETVEVVLDELYDVLMGVLPLGTDLARANLKPRLRMLTLYYVANSRNGLVMGTGNKAEIYVGYYTKFGDGGVDLLPIGGLSKRQVRELAVFLGIPDDIVHKPPSAGLWPGQTDEAEMGLTYDQIDAATALLEGETGVDVSPEVVAKVRRMHAASAHKRAMPPTCPLELGEA